VRPAAPAGAAARPAGVATCGVAQSALTEPTPRRAVELHGLTEASQGRTPPRKLRTSAIFGTFHKKDPAMLPCVIVPDLARLGLAGCTARGELIITSCSKRRCDGGPPAELLTNSDDPCCWRDRAARTLAQVSPPL
jgi:hypothetical protein